jgi:hypothetical protein
MQTASFLLPHLPAAGGSLCDLQLLLVRLTKSRFWQDRTPSLANLRSDFLSRPKPTRRLASEPHVDEARDAGGAGEDERTS